jgi:predicted dehydrogenase
MSNNPFSRRKFLAGAAVVGAAGSMGVGTLASCTAGGAKSGASGVYDWVPREYKFPPMLEKAPEGAELKAGIIGCGGRGSGAAVNFLSAGPGLTITALGDVFQDRVDSCREKIKKEKNLDVPVENCFVGFDAYQKVIDSGVDIIILATPPKFRPEHFEAAVKARKHVFMEKPVAVDPVGIRQVMAAAKMADSMGLKVVTGTQRRHQSSYISLYKEIANNSIGNIVSANVYWNGGKLWHRENKPEWSEMEWMIRDWVNWCWLSGDHIVEQHVHNLDVAMWFFGQAPVKALGFGSRQRRPTGDQFDNFSIDYTFADGRQMHSMCRQINDCTNGVYEVFHGTKATARTDGKMRRIVDPAGNELFSTDDTNKNDPYVQEHIDLVTCIRQDIPFNEAEQTAISNLVAMMGRVSAYTGKAVTYEEMMNSDLKIGPETYIMGNIGYIEKATVPVPGSYVKEK